MKGKVRNNGVKKATTDKLVVTYTNGKSFTIPRVEDVTITHDSVSGEYTQTKQEHGVTRTIHTEFTVEFSDVESVQYLPSGDEPITTVLISNGKLISRTDSVRGNGKWIQEGILLEEKPNNDQILQNFLGSMENFIKI